MSRTGNAIIGGIVMGFLAKPVGEAMYRNNIIVGAGKGPDGNPDSTKDSSAENALLMAILAMSVLAYVVLRARGIAIVAIIAYIFTMVMKYKDDFSKE
jgi:hypothetical protein